MGEMFFLRPPGEQKSSPGSERRPEATGTRGEPALLPGTGIVCGVIYGIIYLWDYLWDYLFMDLFIYGIIYGVIYGIIYGITYGVLASPVPPERGEIPPCLTGRGAGVSRVRISPVQEYPSSGLSQLRNIPLQENPSSGDYPSPGLSQSRNVSVRDHPSSGFIPDQDYPSSGFIPVQDYPNSGFFPVQDYPHPRAWWIWGRGTKSHPSCPHSPEQENFRIKSNFSILFPPVCAPSSWVHPKIQIPNVPRAAAGLVF